MVMEESMGIVEFTILSAIVPVGVVALCGLVLRVWEALS